MLIVSCREGFDNPDLFNPKGHTVRRYSDYSYYHEASPTLLQFKHLVRRKKILFLIHGFRTEALAVYNAYQEIRENVESYLPNRYDYIVGYSWPGGDRLWEWDQAKRAADKAGSSFRFFLESLECESIDIISHSLGARLALTALKHTTRKGLINLYHCMAGAVDDQCLQRRQEFHKSLEGLNRIYLYHSRKDDVLCKAYRIAEFDSPVGLYGPEDKDYASKHSKIYVVDCKSKISSHSGYRHPSLFKLMARTTHHKWMML